MKQFILYTLVGLVTLFIIYPTMFNAQSTILHYGSFLVLIAYLYKAIPYYIALFTSITKTNN